MKRITVLIICISAFLSAYAQPHPYAEEAQNIAESIVADPALSQAVVSICARTGDGRVLMDVNSEKMLVPASNMKLISTGAALHHFGPKFRFETAIGHDGEIVNGVLNGNIYIIGGADPTLGSKDTIATAIDKTFSQWEAFIRKAGIRQVKGLIVGDGSCFEGMTEEPTWLWNDIGTYYGAGATGLMFYENMQSFSVTAGKEAGAPVDIAPSYPDTPWMEFRYDCRTGKEGTGDQLYMYTSDLAPVAEIRGTFGVDRARKRLDCSNKFPEYTCAHYFRNHLKKNGIGSDGTADTRLSRNWKVSGEIKILGKTFSPSLERIIFSTNHASNNLYAETLLRHLGREITGSASYDSSYVAMDKVLKNLRTDTSKGAQIQDGSGLSRQNYISSDFICRFLESMMHSPYFESYVNSLPSPGGNGTMQYNMKSYPASQKDRIKVKSGSMNGVRCYSGYVIPVEGAKEETIIFSMMVNNCTSPTWKVRPLLDKLMGALSSYN